MAHHVPESNVKRVLKNIDAFSRRFQKAMSESTEEREDRSGYFISTFSVHLLLSCLYEGSNGQTMVELDEQLKMQEDEVVPATYNTILRFLREGHEDIDLYIPTKIYVSDTYATKDAYTITLSQLLYTEVELISFINNITAAERVNNWSQRLTDFKVPDLVDASDFEVGSRMVLVSSVCFQADWLYDFPAHKTETETFTITTNQTIQVEMMTFVGHFDYIFSKILEAQVVRLPFRNQTFSMLIFLPNPRTGMYYLEKQLMTISFHDLIQNMKEEPIRLKLPKFRLETKLDVQEPLERYPIIRPYHNLMNFIKISEDENGLFLTGFFQKTTLAVNEGGVSCYINGASIEQRRQNYPEKPPFVRDTIYVNRPFKFAIVAEQEGYRYPLFMGRIYHP